MQRDTTLKHGKSRKHLNSKNIYNLTGIQLQIIQSKSHLRISYIFWKSMIFLKCHCLWLRLGINYKLEARMWESEWHDLICFWKQQSGNRKFSKNLYASLLLSEAETNRQILNGSALLSVHFHTTMIFLILSSTLEIEYCQLTWFYQKSIFFQASSPGDMNIWKPPFSLKMYVLKCLINLKSSSWILGNLL